MKLVIFDMDGTLTDSFAFAENIYVRAFAQAFDLPDVRIDWASFPHTSSSYCLDAVLREHFGRAATPADSRAVTQAALRLMAEIQQNTGRRTRAIPGAAAALRELRRCGYAVAVASGDWEATARHKFATAEIPLSDLPFAFCEAGHARTEIMRTALARAAAHHGRAGFDRITYIGDAAWDVRACRELGWPLVGIGEHDHAAHLRSLGVTHVLPHYLDFDGFLQAVEQAGSPQ
ncbi:MAG: HAD family hydrolase [Opitutae bacterium]|nr:HAD family hydrolase [Opitutae bacterium]